MNGNRPWRRQRWIVWVFLVVSLMAVGYWRFHSGPGDLQDVRLGTILWSLRAQAVLVAGLAGAALAVAGVLMQGIFRNPLADPGIIGVGSGAKLGGMVAMAVFELALVKNSFSIPYEVVVPLGCMAGALLALFILLLVMRFHNEILTVLLAGVILSMLFVSLGGFLQAIVSERWELARSILTFTMGDISGKGFRQIGLAAPLILLGIVAAVLLGRPLDLLLSGEEEARSLGVDTSSVRWWSVLWTAILVAAAVTLGGNVAFLGLIVPHILRRFVGSNHRRLAPLAALAGAVFVIACDALSISLGTRSLVPLGVITGLVGAPVFFFILIKGRGVGVWS